MVIGQGSTTETLGADSVRDLLARALEPIGLDGKRVLVIIPDGTRTAPIPLLFRLLYEQLGRRVARLDYLIALGTQCAIIFSSSGSASSMYRAAFWHTVRT